MMASKTVDELQFLETLDDLLASVAGGRASIGALNTWFMSCEWEARMASDSAALRLGWRIQNLLYTWQDYRDEVTAEWILESVRDLIDEEPSLRPFLARSLADGQNNRRNTERNLFEGNQQPISIGWTYPVVSLGAA